MERENWTTAMICGKRISVSTVSGNQAFTMYVNGADVRLQIQSKKKMITRQMTAGLMLGPFSITIENGNGHQLMIDNIILSPLDIDIIIREEKDEELKQTE